MRSSEIGKSTIKTLLAILVIIAIVVGVFYGTYNWQHHKVNVLNNKINNLNSQVSSLSKDLSTISDQLKTCPSINQNSATITCANYSYVSRGGVTIYIFNPTSNQKVSSPIAVIGEVPGNWSFEAEFPIQLKNSKGAVIDQVPAHLLGDWMTTELVPFSAQLTYTGQQTGVGTITLQKESGKASSLDSVSIPIQF